MQHGLALASYVGSTFTCVLRRFARSATRASAGTLLDAPDVASVVTLVRLLGRPHEGADELADRLTRLYGLFPPTEPTMRRLSLLHQRHGDEGGLRSFCVAIVYMAATEAILHGASVPQQQRKRSRPHSR